MSSRRKRYTMADLCSEPGPGDGEDPRFDDRPNGLFPTSGGRKVQQLCRQVQIAIELTLASECQDPMFDNLEVVQVDPAPNASRLMVTFRLHEAEEGSGVDPQTVADRLDHARGLFRIAVAEAICRRKTPELCFRVVQTELE